MKQAGYGRIVNTSSASGLFGSFGQSAYSAAKMALVGFTKTLALEGARYGIAVNAIAPGALTRMTGDVLGEDSDTARSFGWSGDELADRMGPHQVSPVVAYLAHESCPLNGEVLSASGGRVARAFVAVTRGAWHEALTPEFVAAHLDEIIAEDGYVVADDAGDEIRLLRSFLP
jgi:NAD(P)-dependent dehydrogenase (short-subunit alcohol dehydrogenase family)